MYRQVLLKLAQMGLLAALGACGQGCMEAAYECQSHDDCPAGLECVVHFPNGGRTHTSSYCMRARFTGDLHDPTDSSNFDIGGQDIGGDSGGDPGLDPGQDPGADPGVEDSKIDLGVDSGIDLGADPGNDAGYEPGTWFDWRWGLTWENPPTGRYLDWEEARAHCESLWLEGGGWRLPSISELRTLIRDCEATELEGNCGVTDECLDLSCRGPSCNGCAYDSGPAEGCYWPHEMEGACRAYWSSSRVEFGPEDAYYVRFIDGRVSVSAIVSSGYDFAVRCVR